ncbi:MAG: winged helix-turn-helix domain-containing protein, partial [Brevundimonas sp.]
MTGPDQTARGLAHERDFTIGAMMFRPSLCEAEIGGEVRHLEPRVALVLLALGQAEGSVLSRDDLIARCWDGVVVGDDAINRVIGKIRRL